MGRPSVSHSTSNPKNKKGDFAMKTFAIVNRKGGVGKTTTAINLAYILATSCGKRVLLVDADSQANLTSQCGVTVVPGGGLTAVLRGMADYYQDVIFHTDVPDLDIIPATEELGDIDLECIQGGEGADLRRLLGLREAIEEDDAYDVAVIDCPPYFSVSCLNAIAAADRIIIPTDTDAFSAVGMAGLVRQLDSIRRACPDVSVSGGLVTKWHRADIVDDAVDYLRQDGPIHIFDTVIRRTDKVQESTWAGQAAAQWSPFCAASRDYRAFVAELMEREGMSHGC